MVDTGYKIGWWIESEDEEVYGPVSRSTVQQFLRDGTISRNTLVRHCTQEMPQPVADQPGMLEGLPADDQLSLTGDRLESVWPSGRQERRDLAETDIECARHHRAAVVVCVRCHAPCCDKCRMKPFQRQFYFCRRCQASHNNRRVLAIMLDSLLMYMVLLPVIVGTTATMMATTGPSESSFISVQAIWQLLSWFGVLALIFRDAVCRGAGPGKRMVGLRVVRHQDGQTPLGYCQALVRYLSLLIPFGPIIEAVVMYRDPLLRRWGDRWAKTRVIDTPRKLAKVRAKTYARLQWKGMEPVLDADAIPMDQFARFAG